MKEQTPNSSVSLQPSPMCHPKKCFQACSCDSLHQCKRVWGRGRADPGRRYRAENL